MTLGMGGMKYFYQSGRKIHILHEILIFIKGGIIFLSQKYSNLSSPGLDKMLKYKFCGREKY